MQDTYGNELGVGDYVAFAPHKWSSRAVELGFIEKFTPKKVVIRNIGGTLQPAMFPHYIVNLGAY